MKLYKTTVVIWSEYHTDFAELEEIPTGTEQNFLIRNENNARVAQWQEALLLKRI